MVCTDILLIYKQHAPYKLMQIKDMHVIYSNMSCYHINNSPVSQENEK